MVYSARPGSLTERPPAGRPRRAVSAALSGRLGGSASAPSHVAAAKAKYRQRKKHLSSPVALDFCDIASIYYSNDKFKRQIGFMTTSALFIVVQNELRLSAVAGACPDWRAPALTVLASARRNRRLRDVLHLRPRFSPPPLALVSFAPSRWGSGTHTFTMRYVARERHDQLESDKSRQRSELDRGEFPRGNVFPDRALKWQGSLNFKEAGSAAAPVEMHPPAAPMTYLQRTCTPSHNECSEMHSDEPASSF
ncbi:hypothetical protein EVAR_91412_1 [Eumeta japonica]|uniref:Uncharacterized protein n=1 Tax=Eumeta variegata TaxID=151549 RepID=A0A4C1X9C3_EUMVA|nr:hypothetical protein EVAR_91412_1 [Eumeta japonica]